MLTSKKVFISGNKTLLKTTATTFFSVIAPRALQSFMVHLTKLLGLKTMKGTAFPARTLTLRLPN
jgi:hypothetical protein